MRITKIEKQTKRPGRKNVYADGEFLIGLSDEALVRAGLRVGDDVSQEQLNALRDAEEHASSKRAALRLLARRPRTVREIRDRLREKEFPDDIVAATIEDLKRAGLLNDSEFAQMYLRDSLSLRPAGKLLLKRKLLLLGIDKETAETSLEQAFGNVRQEDAALQMAVKFVKKARATRKTIDMMKLRSRTAGFLGRHGYSWDVIGPILKKLFHDTDLMENIE